MKMRIWIVLPASAIWLVAASLVCAQDTVAQFTQTQGGPEFKLVTDPLGDTTFSTTDTTSGVPISFTYFTSQPPVPNPQPGTLVLSAIATSSSFGSNFASIDFANPQDDTLAFKDAQGNTLMSANFTGTLFLSGTDLNGPNQNFTSGSLQTLSVTYGPGFFPPAGATGQFAIGLSSFAVDPAHNTLLAAGAGTFDVSSLPEPASLSTLGIALAAMTLRRRRTAARV